MGRKPRISRQTKQLLAVLATDAGRWQHGYEISQQTGLKSGTLYPLLMRLSDQGWLEARWTEPERVGRPPRHEYRLTSAGAALAREQAEAAIGQADKSEEAMKGVVLA
jgi:DNA-binding PadR family transcriptional regulator